MKAVFAVGLLTVAFFGPVLAKDGIDEELKPFRAKNQTIGAAEKYWLLNRACSYGDDHGAAMLISAGADPDGLKDYREFIKEYLPEEPSCPINQAAWGGHAKVVAVLIKAGAKVD